MKICYRCKASKKLEDFNLNSRTKDGRHSYCRDCSKQHYRDNAERHKANVSRRKRENPGAKYGLSKEAYNALKLHYPMCGICKDVKPTCIDHDHVTGEVRGLLCNMCNLGLGLFKDNAEHLLSAVTYLRRFV